MKTLNRNEIEELVIERLTEERITLDYYAFFNIIEDVYEIQYNAHCTAQERIDFIFDESIKIDKSYDNHIYILDDDEDYTHYLTAGELMSRYRDTKESIKN